MSGVPFTGQSSSSPNVPSNFDPQVYVSLTQIVYALVIGESFTLLTGKYQVFFTQPASNVLGILSLFLVYTIIVTSWVGYNHAIKAYPYTPYPFRFILDLAILFLYFVLTTTADNFNFLLGTFVWIFTAYTAWDFFRYAEYRKDPTKGKGLQSKMVISGGFIAGFLLLLLFHNMVGSQSQILVGIDSVLAFVGLVAYRWLKWRYRD